MTNLTPWFERSFRFDFSTGQFPIIFSRLEGTLFRLSHLLATADEAAAESNTFGWSVKEEVGHLYDLEVLWWQRLNDFRTGKPQLTTADLSNRQTFTAGHNQKTLEQLMRQFAGERQRLLETVYEFDEAVLLLTSLHPRLQQPMRLIDSLFFVAEHDDHHIAKISERLRVAQGIQ